MVVPCVDPLTQMFSKINKVTPMQSQNTKTRPQITTLSIYLVDGTRQTFQYKRTPEDEMRMATRVSDFLSSNAVAIQLADKTLFIPIERIKSIEVAPPLDVHVGGVIGPAVEI